MTSTIITNKRPSSAELLELTGVRELSSLAFIGLSKNAGKTSSLNHLLMACMNEGFERPLALTSIGRDGEESDVVTQTEKPRIYAPAGSLLLTATSSLQRSDALLDILELSGIYTAFGEIALCRVLIPGYVELAGPSIAQELRQCEALLRRTAPNALYLIDGALSRRSPAGGGLSEAAVLAFNAGHSGRISELLRSCRHALRLLTLPAVDQELQRKLASALGETQEDLRALALDENGGFRPLRLKTLLGGDELRDFVDRTDRGLMLRGALTDRSATALLKARRARPFRLIAEDGTRIFLSPAKLRELETAGIELNVLCPLRLLWLAFNPRLDDGSPLSSAEILPRLQAELPLPVFDLGPALMV